MLKNKLFRMSLIILISIALLGVVAIIAFTYLKKSGNTETPHAIAAKDLEATQYTMEKITTNLQGSNFVQIALTLQADSKKSREELDQRKIQVKDIVNSILHTTTKMDLDKADGQDKLKKEIMTRINKLMTEGKVIDVYITEIVTQ